MCHHIWAERIYLIVQGPVSFNMNQQIAPCVYHKFHIWLVAVGNLCCDSEISKWSFVCKEALNDHWSFSIWWFKLSRIGVDLKSLSQNLIKTSTFEALFQMKLDIIQSYTEKFKNIFLMMNITRMGLIIVSVIIRVVRILSAAFSVTESSHGQFSRNNHLLWNILQTIIWWQVVPWMLLPVQKYL